MINSFSNKFIAFTIAIAFCLAIHLAAKQSGLLDGLERMVVYNFTDK